MKVTFIRPNLFQARSHDAMHPLCFAILKSLTPSDVETVLYDERLEAIPLDEPTDLVAITVETYTARRAYDIAGEYRRRGVKVVMGGFHPTLLPAEALQHADAVVQGDAEGVWERVLEDVRRGRLSQLYRQETLPPLRGLTPDRSIFAGKRYAPITLVQYGRGCKFNCDFCSIRAFYGSNLRQRPVSEVVKEIERTGSRHVFFIDDNIFVDLPRAKELFRALVPLRIRWGCQTSIDITRHQGLMDLMARSGCATALVGFESLNIASLKQMNKGWHAKYGDYGEAIRSLRERGIGIYGSFVFGYDGETPDAFGAAVELAIQNRFTLANFIPLTPTPGTPLIDRLQLENRLIYDDWWLHPSFRYGEATFHPRGMSAEELTEGCYRSRQAFNSCGSVVRRMLDRRTHMRSPFRLGVYIQSNIIARREIALKQGRALGTAAPTPDPWPAIQR